jgi:suppressor of G2 allele of SKP1
VLADTAPSYPTSSKSGPKNWDKVVSDMTTKPKKKGGDDDADGEGGRVDDMDDLDYGGDEANFFFKKLYAGADEDTKRAMMKSYVESNGTVLSTNWSEVGKGKVETSPPDGMEAKTWGK